MTIMIPKECIDACPATQTLHQNLYNSLGPSYTVVEHIKSKEIQGKDIFKSSIFWIQHNNKNLFICLSNAPASFFNKKSKNECIAIKSKIIHHPDFLALTNLQASLLPSPLRAHKANLTPFLVIFNNTNEEDLNVGIKSLGIYLLSKENIASNNLYNLVEKYLGDPTSSAIKKHIRRSFNPELAIYSSYVDNFLLDNEQESALKSDLNLSTENTRYEHFNLRGINGDINSGKSEVILQRAKLINQLTPNELKRVLILTPDSNTQFSLRIRYDTLNPLDQKTEILSLNQWCEKIITPNKRISDIEESEQLIQDSLENTHIEYATFLQELEFIMGRLILSKKDYLKANRPTPSHPLDNNEKKNIWDALQVLLKSLKEKNSILNLELPQLAWAFLQKTSAIEQYDHILLDDAHLFSPIAFSLIKKSIKPKTGQLFITQNPNQIKPNSCRIWQDAGLELRGHSTRLLKTYLFNSYVLNAANSFYLRRLPSNIENITHNNVPKTDSNNIPTVLHFLSHRDEENRLINKVQQHLKEGLAPESLLIITANNEATEHFTKVLHATINISVQKLIGPERTKGKVGICNLLHAHGKNTSHIFIVGLHHIYNAEKKLDKDSQEHKSLVMANTKKLTIAMNCAQKELTLFITAETIPRDFISPHFHMPTFSTKPYDDVLTLHA